MHTSPQAVLFAIGTELVSGASQDTNSRHATRLLAALGIEVKSISLVSDDLDEIVRPLRLALEDADLILISGGLGPTADDLTREAVAQALGVELRFHPELLAAIQERYARLGRVMPEANRRQAYLPEGAEPLENPRGTAPGIWDARSSRLLASMPGVPREFCHMLEELVVPRIAEHFADRLLPHRTRCLLATGVSESALGERVEKAMRRGANPELGVTAKMGAITLRLVAHGTRVEEVEELLDQHELELRELLGPDLCQGHPETPELALAACPDLSRIAVVDQVGFGYLATRLGRAGIDVSGWVGEQDFLRLRLTGLESCPDPEAAARLVASQAGVQAGVALLRSSPGQLEIGVVLGEEALSTSFSVTADLGLDRSRCEAAALDLLRRLGEGVPPTRR